MEDLRLDLASIERLGQENLQQLANWLKDRSEGYLKNNHRDFSPCAMQRHNLNGRDDTPIPKERQEPPVEDLELWLKLLENALANNKASEMPINLNVETPSPLLTSASISMTSFNRQLNLSKDSSGNPDFCSSSYMVNNSTKESTMRITRNNKPLNLKVYDKFVLKKLGFTEWLELHTLAFRVQTKSNDQEKKEAMKRKRRVELVHKVFVKEDIMADGMHKNLVPPERVVRLEGLVIREPESWISIYNGNFDLVFQREEKFHLATTTQLIRVQNAIKIDFVEAKEMFDKMIYVIEARNDVVEASKIVQDNLDNLG
ncbi:hypothetical protein Tco_1570877 [Tanacetum coccineum]